VLRFVTPYTLARKAPPTFEVQPLD